MARQSAKNVTIAFKVESAFNTPPTTADAEFLRFTPSAGLNQTAANIQSNEARTDGLTSMGRLGSRSVQGSYSGEMSLGSHDTIYEALMRGTWAAALTITEATGEATEITTVADGIVGDTGSWIDAGLRVGDVIRLTGHSTTANNDKNLRIAALSATKITTHETLVVNSTPDTAFTITRGKKLVNPASPTKRTFYIDQRFVDVDGSQVFGGCRWTSLTVTGSPDGMAEVEFGVLGASMATLEGSESPYFVSPTAYNSRALVFADATINYAGTDIAVLTAFDLSYEINAALQAVVGSRTSPDVFDNNASLSGNMSMIREDFANVTRFADETEFKLHILLTEPESEPKDYISIFVPRCRLTDASAPIGGDGAMIESLPFEAGAQAEDLTNGLDATMLTIVTSAA